MATSGRPVAIRNFDSPNLNGYTSCKYLKKFGEPLRPDLGPKYEKGLKNSREAEAAEARLAAWLRKGGDGVLQN